MFETYVNFLKALNVLISEKMEESLSEASERSKSQDSSNSDPSNDARLIAETKSSQLAAKNALLTKENTILKAQIDQSKAIEPKIEKFFQDNKYLTSENRRLKDEIDDIQKRYLILQNSNHDLQKQADEERLRSTLTQKQFTDTSKQEIKNIKSKYQSQMDQISKQLDAIQSKSEKDDIIIKTFNNKIERLLENASNYFNQKFYDIDSFTSFLSTPNSPQRQAPQPSPDFTSQVPQDSVAQLEKKVKKEKQKAKKLENERDKLEETVRRMQREISDLKNDHQDEIEKLNKEKREKSEEQALSDFSTSHRIQALESRIETLTRKNEELKEKVEQAEKPFRQPDQTARYSFTQRSPQSASRYAQQPQFGSPSYRQSPAMYRRPLFNGAMQRPGDHVSFAFPHNYQLGAADVPAQSYAPSSPQARSGAQEDGNTDAQNGMQENMKDGGSDQARSSTNAREDGSGHGEDGQAHGSSRGDLVGEFQFQLPNDANAYSSARSGSGQAQSSARTGSSRRHQSDALQHHSSSASGRNRSHASCSARSHNPESSDVPGQIYEYGSSDGLLSNQGGHSQNMQDVKSISEELTDASRQRRELQVHLESDEAARHSSSQHKKARRNDRKRTSRESSEKSGRSEEDRHSSTKKSSKDESNEGRVYEMILNQ